MTRRIRIPLRNGNLESEVVLRNVKDSVGKTKYSSRDMKYPVETREIYKRVTGDYSILNYKPLEERRRDVEDGMVEALDEKALLIEMMRELLPVFKKTRELRDADDILRTWAPAAAKVLVKNTLFGDERAQNSAAKEILDRVNGRAVERQVSLNADLGSLKDPEVDRELGRIFHKLGRDIFVESAGDGPGGKAKTAQVSQTEGKTVGGGEIREVLSEHSSEKVFRKQGKG